ncbi:Lanosterol synthase (Oxidosqualene--lanosterol cyclase) [Pleurotus pulmonarius]|nr:Lanosterol synthase (Oxidosqualene--lanosterol cyclase) [Pleurotus pulmonarius]KAF4591242.1 Lanosterol synthase (Oxidosqualene--lanosterol cyclase) [Pleurotus pulmonarius]
MTDAVTSQTPEIPFTDYSRWRLRLGEGGRHTWHYLKTDKECEEWPQTDIDRYWLGLPLVQSKKLITIKPAENAFEAARRGFEFVKHIQAPDGHLPGEYSGPMFLLPGMVIGSYASGQWFEEEERLEMIRYLLNRAHPEDGGWGIHVEGPSTVLGTSLNYCALRLLGVGKDHPAAVKARDTLHKLGGAVASPSWGKFWMSVLNVYEWEGNNPIPPELWLLPDWVPIHPWRWWIHTRAVYIPMSYLYRVQFKVEETPLILSLREELYTTPYRFIDWPAQRNNIAQIDLYSPHTAALDILNTLLSLTVETCTIPAVQRRALDRVYELICKEDENTCYQDIAPVSKMMQMVCRAHREGCDSEAVRKHAETRADFMWVRPDGMCVRGTNGSQLWDTGFAAQAVVETGLADLEENKASTLNILTWIVDSQMTENPKHYESAYRHSTKGAWGFSTKEQNYTLSDCTGEGLKAVLYLQNKWSDSPKLMSDRRIFDSVDLMIGMQNSDGGFASYEKIRGPRILEALNPSEVFGDIMIEFNYPECTTSVITALSVFRKYYPEYRKDDISRVVSKAINFLHKAQRPEGGWFGSWGICFTYATMFALESLALVGETYATSESARRACEFLLDKQMDDGGWGETYKSCETEQYHCHERSQVVQTSWAAMALMFAQYPRRKPIARAVKLVMSRQLPDGSWEQEAIEGIFNKTCTITYPNFKLVFTVWMLGLAHKYLQRTDLE